MTAEMFTRDELLAGLPARRARTLLFLIESKSALADNVIGGDSRWITELSTDDLRDLIELREEALESEEEA